MREAYSLVWSVVPVAGLIGSWDPDPSSSTQHPATACAEESGVECHGSPDLCWAVSFGAKCHQGADDREARYRHPLASCRFQIVLALEIPEPLRPTNCSVGNSPADPRDEHRQPVVGSAENPRRASQARHRDRPDQRRQVYGAEEGPSLARMEDVPSQPCGWHCRNGPLRRADNLVPTTLWFADHGPRPAADPVVWGDRAPDGRMARQSAH